MHVQCPNCLCDLDVVPAQSVLEVKCPSCGSQVDVSSHAETVAYQAPKLGRLGPFELMAHIGRGHFGDVYKARDSRLERLVAVKVPRTDDLVPAAREAFFREARTAARLRHANIVTVHEVNTAGEKIYIASELIDGVNLADLISGRRLEPRRAARIAADVADALHHAHEHDVVHRDLKPRNIMLDEADEPHLLDFGLAKQSASEFTITSEGDILGTPAYMAPEQARGQAGSADRRTDVYSLGVTLYEMLTGRRPFVGEVRGLIFQILHDDPTPPRKIEAGIPRDLETICLKAMAKRPEARYATATEMAADLRRFLAGEPIRARRAGPAERALSWCRRNPALTASASLATAASLVLGVWAYASAVNEPGLPPRDVEIDVRLAVGRFQDDNVDPPAKSAHVVCWPRDEEGQPITDRIPTEARGTPPLRLRLPPGEYLIVADDDSGRFHEVYRRVPTESERVSPGAYRHQDYELQGSTVILPPFSLPLPEVVADMAALSGADAFTVGDLRIPQSPAHQRRLPPFLLDRREVSVADLRALSRLQDTHRAHADRPATEPASRVTWHQAAAWAELAGKRLPSEVEYEFAATNGGTTSFPWGETAPPTGNWQSRPLDAPSADRTSGASAIEGLYSSVPEWTSTWLSFYPALKAQGIPLPAEPRDWRVVRGAPLSLFNDNPADDGSDPLLSPRFRHMMPLAGQQTGMGFRCARSARPRLVAADFEATLSDAENR